MRFRRKLLMGVLVIVITSALLAMVQSKRNHFRSEGVPKTWDEDELADLMVPLVSSEHSPKFVSSGFYYWIPIRPLLKTYRVYHPDHEPDGYIEWLKQQSPEQAWIGEPPTSRDEWIQMGKLVFEAPIFGGALGAGDPRYASQLYVRDPKWHANVKAPVAKDGTLPFYRYIVEEAGQVRVGILSCAMCHTRVLTDGIVVSGAQGNFPFDRALAYDCRVGGDSLVQQAGLERLLFHVPWVEATNRVAAITKEGIAAQHEAIPPGVMARHGSSPEFPVAIPDLFDLTDRHYFDRTGLQRNRGIADIMRYAALNQGADDFSYYGEFSPMRDMVGYLFPPFLVPTGRYSDDQLYALAIYLESLDPPPNSIPKTELTKRGQQVFADEGCARCHTPPLYTSNKLTPVESFEVPDEHYGRFEIEPESVGTDEGLATRTRRGTGYYKIPSLRNVWMRGPFGHDGSCATLEDWFNPERLQDDYEPTGFVGLKSERRSVPGHEFGLNLDKADREALIVFLKTL